MEKWAAFFREAGDLGSVPASLAEPSIVKAFDAARGAGFTEDEWEAYIRAGMATQDGRGALSMSLKQGREEGREQGREEGRVAEARAALRRVLGRRGFALTAEEQSRIDGCTDLADLARWLEEAVVAGSAAEALK